MYKHKIRNKYILDIFKKMVVTRGQKKCDKNANILFSDGK